MYIEPICSKLPLPSLSRTCRLFLVTVLLLGTTACDRLSPEQGTEREGTAAQHSSHHFPREWSNRAIETKDGTIVEYRMNNVVMRFPKDIVVENGDENGIVVLFRWPTKEWARTIANPDMIEVAIYFAQHPSFAAKRARITGPDSDMVRVEDPATPDLLVYEHREYGPVGARYLSNDEETIDANGDLLAILGSAGAAPLLRLCKVWFQIAPGVAMRYSYYDKHLPDWKAIHQAIFQHITIESE